MLMLMLNDQKLYMCITHSMILVSRYKGKLHGGKRGHQILTRSPPPFGQCLKKTFLAWRGAPLFLLSLLSLAAIGYKYLLSKVNYDISLDIFPTCTFADTPPPDAATKIRPPMIYNSAPNASLPLQSTKRFLIFVGRQKLQKVVCL